jgi:hypothetical protein
VRAEGRHSVTDEVDAAKGAVKLSGRDSLCDRGVSQADAPQLLPRDASALPPGDPSDPAVDIRQNVTLADFYEARGVLCRYRRHFSPVVSGVGASVALCTHDDLSRLG